MWLGVVAPLVALLGNVAKADIRGTGTPSEAILEQLASIPAADQLLPTPDIALNAAVSGSYVLEVNSSQGTADALTDGGGDVDDDGAPGPAPESGRALARDVGGEDDDDEDAGGEGDNLSTVDTVLIVLISAIVAAALLYLLWPYIKIVLAVLVYLLWPWIETCWKASPKAQKMAAGVTATGAAPLTGKCVDPPPLCNSA